MTKRIMSMVLALAMVLSLAGAFSMISGASADVDPNGVYVTPTGAGSKDGSGWENAMAGDSAGGLQAAWEKVKETGTLYIGSGSYLTTQTLVIKQSHSGKSLDAMRSIVGVDTGAGKPVFKGPFTLENQKGTFIKMESGASYVKIDNLKTEQYMYPIDMRGKHIGIRIYNIDAYEMADGIYMRGGATAENPLDGNKDIIVDSCNFIRYTKSAIRILDGNNGVLVSNSVGDAGGVDFWFAGNFPLGFHALGGDGVWDENITYVDCVGMGAYQRPDDITTYWNGDGFCSEQNTRNITYIRCRAYNNTDGGWDDKCKNPTFIDSITSNNKRNWRLWNGATIINGLNSFPKHPDPAMGAGPGMWAGRYSTPKIYNTTFYNAPISIELGGLELYDTIHVRPNGGGFYNAEFLTEGETLITRGVVTWDGKTGTDPQIKNPTDDRFNGIGDNFNSLVFGPEKGYYYSPETFSARTLPTSEMKADAIVDVTSVYDWAKDSIEFMTKSDYMPGITTYAFAPYANMTRVQFAAMLVRTLGVKATAGESFTDMERFKKWKDPVYGVQYFDDIAIAKAAGIIKGTETENGVFFNPGETITRQDMMVMLGRALKAVGKLPNDYNAALSSLDTFSDKDGIADYAKQEVANMVEKGIIKGGTDGTINPLGKAIRAEGAVIGKRIYDLQ